MAWNAFKLCKALRALGYIMVAVVLAIVGLTYYAVVLVNCMPAILSGGLNAVIAFPLLILFHFLLVMLLWSYFYCVITDPGGVPLNWRPAIDEEATDSAPLVGSEYGGAGLCSNQSTMVSDPANQKVRFCRKCNHYKPPRCHHCSVCGRCILKMDHHCVWVVNCVGALNYKYFLLFLFYTFLETTLVTLTLFKYFMAFFTDEEIAGTLSTVAASFITFVLNFAFALSVFGFMIMHLSLVASNTTTIEAYEKKASPRWQYDLGRKKNFLQLFGTDKWYWFIPAYSEEDLRRIPALQGIDYPTRPELNALQPL